MNTPRNSLQAESAEYLGISRYGHPLAVPNSWTKQTVRVELKEGVPLGDGSGVHAAKGIQEMRRL